MEASITRMCAWFGGVAARKASDDNVASLSMRSWARIWMMGDLLEVGWHRVRAVILYLRRLGKDEGSE
jgi:hypothetical protein